MYINRVKIYNYKCFKDVDIKLSKLSIIVGENNSGKSCLFNAISLPLSFNELSIHRKNLGVNDINRNAIKEFGDSIRNDSDNISDKIPSVIVEVEFTDPKNSYEKEILSKWLLKEEDGNLIYGLKYVFEPKDSEAVINEYRDRLNDNANDWLVFPIELYEYRIISTNNEKLVSFTDLKNIKINSILAERDNFSEKNNIRSNSILSQLLLKSLGQEELNSIHIAYANFFKGIKDTESFSKLINPEKDFENINEHIKQLGCIPNLPDLKNIISNITLSYDDEYLHQKGLGQRNLVYLYILFTYFLKEKSLFKLCCIEEPEAHLCINNLKLVTDYLTKSINKANSLLQVIISTHSPYVISKLNMENVIVLVDGNAISLNDVSTSLINYLKKRPNFDILQLLFSNRIILVEGTTEEMLINAFLSKNNKLNNIDVISVGQKGFKTFLEIWLRFNKGSYKKIGIIRDYDNQDNAKVEHEIYQTENPENIIISTTVNYTLENDLVEANFDNLDHITKALSLDINSPAEEVEKYLIANKAESMLSLCDSIINSEETNILLPNHIKEVIEFLS